MSPGAVNLHLLLSPPAVREPSREGASAGVTLLGVHFHSDAGEGEGEVWVDFLSFALSENLGSLRS